MVNVCSCGNETTALSVLTSVADESSQLASPTQFTSPWAEFEPRVRARQPIRVGLTSPGLVGRVQLMDLTHEFESWTWTQTQLVWHTSIDPVCCTGGGTGQHHNIYAPPTITQDSINTVLNLIIFSSTILCETSKPWLYITTLHNSNIIVSGSLSLSKIWSPSGLTCIVHYGLWNQVWVFWDGENGAKSNCLHRIKRGEWLRVHMADHKVCSECALSAP